MLCVVVLYCVMLHVGVLGCRVYWYDIICRAVLYYVLLYYDVLCYMMLVGVVL